MSEVKVTRKEMFARIAEICAAEPEIVEFCEKQIEVLSKPRKAKENTEVVEFRNAVATWLSEQSEPITNAECALALQVSPQKSASALNWLAKEGVAVKVSGEKTKDKATYAIA